MSRSRSISGDQGVEQRGATSISYQRAVGTVSGPDSAHGVSCSKLGSEFQTPGSDAHWRQLEANDLPNMFKSSGRISFDPSTDIPDLTGKVIIVTGGTHNTSQFSIVTAWSLTLSWQGMLDSGRRLLSSYANTTPQESTWPHDQRQNLI